MNIMFILVYFTLFIDHMVDGGIYQEHYNYLKEQGIKCGVIPLQEKGSASRVINGRIATAIYPWMAQIKQKEVDAVSSEWFFSGGSIITHKVVLTCGHCICAVESMDCTLGGQSEPNLNKAGQNEIHVVVGDPSGGAHDPYVLDDTLKFDDRIEAYFYRYKKVHDSDNPLGSMFVPYSFHGDVGIVINHEGHGHMGPNLAPICLPDPHDHAPTSEKGLKVNTAGWGERDIEYSTDGTTQKILCQTNQGKKTEGLPGTRQTAFFPCRDQILGGQHFCAKIPRNIHTFSQDSSVTFDNNQMKINPSPTSPDKCEQYWKRAKKAFYQSWTLRMRNYMRKHKSFFRNFDQLVIQKDDCQGAVIDVCYNMQSAGKYGICQAYLGTFGSSVKLGWGFCSRSCALASGDTEYEYEEARLRYYDDPPTGSVLTQRKKQLYSENTRPCKFCHH